MSINLNTSNVATRENRIGSITGYIGKLSDLAQQSQCGTLKGCSRCFSQSSTCLSSCALAQLSAIRNVAVIHHGPSGCSVAGAGSYYLSRVMAKKRGVTSDTVYVGTDMNENDTIFGSTEELRKIILEVNRRYKPEAIFVTSSCATGIIGEDIDSVVDEVREEIDVPVAAVHCEGFKSRIWATGFDISDHAVLSTIVKPPEKKTNKINFKNFYESARPEIIEMFKNFDLEPVFLYCNSTVEELSHISEAAATTCICGTLGNYLGNGLEEKYGVPYIRSVNPLGIKGFETWLREIGRVTERTEAVEKYIAEQREMYIPQAEFNLLVSPWVSVGNMKKMEKKLGIPYLHYPTLPIGAFETSKFLREVGKFTGVSEEKVESVINEHENYYYYLIERYADLFLETRVMAKEFTVVSDAQYALGITKFLVNDLGLLPAKQFITDDTPKAFQDKIRAEFENLNDGIKAEVSFETDSWKIHEEIDRHDYNGYPLILGSYYEKEITEKKSGHYLNISWPVKDKVVMDDFYVGYTGGIRLIEDIYSVAVQRWN